MAVPAGTGEGGQGVSRLAPGRSWQPESAAPAMTRPPTDGEPRSPGAPGMPGFRLVIGVDGDPREWVQVANALLERIASGAVRAGSRVPPVTSLGLETAVPPGAAGRAFRVLASEGVLYWVPRLGYPIRATSES